MTHDNERLHDDLERERAREAERLNEHPHGLEGRDPIPARSPRLEGRDPTPAVSGLGGAAIGAAAGALAGPVGIAIGALAGAVGGWWAGRAIHRAASEYEREDATFRERHATLGAEHPEYDAARPAYQLGYFAGRNPEYRTKTFEEIEEHVRLGWTPDVSSRHGEWTRVRPYAEHGYGVGRTREPIAHDREVPLAGTGAFAAGDTAADQARADAGVSDLGADVERSAESGEVVYPSEIDALANGIPAEPDSAAAREFGISREEAERSERESP